MAQRSWGHGAVENSRDGVEESTKLSAGSRGCSPQAQMLWQHTGRGEREQVEMSA